VAELAPDDPARARDVSRPHHLPNLRPGKEPPHTSWLPRQRRGTTPQMVGRYPDYDVFDARDTWDEATARLVDERMRHRAGDPLTFFTSAEAPTLRAFCDVCVAQDDDPRVPVAEMVDEKLAAGRLDGYQYADMPDDRDTWRIVLAGLDHAASARHGAPSFSALSLEDQEELVGALSGGELDGGPWEQVDVKRAWSVCMRMVLAAFYSHPWAWNEIGFGGPAYPRGFMRLGPTSTLEPFERAGATSEDPVPVADEMEP
jgi:hypothetical protein